MDIWKDGKMKMDQHESVPTKVFYNNIRELITEWKQLECKCSLWEYLELSESSFKLWMAKCKAGVFEN